MFTAALEPMSAFLSCRTRDRCVTRPGSAGDVEGVSPFQPKAAENSIIKYGQRISLVDLRSVWMAAGMRLFLALAIGAKQFDGGQLLAADCALLA